MFQYDLISGEFIIRKANVANKGRLLKYGTFFICWIIGICSFLVFSVNNKLNTFRQKPTVPLNFDLPSNRIGAFRFVRYNPEESDKPSFSVSFDNLLIENNKLGIFKSAAHQIVRISNLEVRSYHYPENSTETCNSIHDPACPDSFKAASEGCSNNPKQTVQYQNDIIRYARSCVKYLMNKQDGWRINFDIATANVSELVINDFNYSIFCGNDLVLSIQSKRAITSYSSSGLILRGQVIIKSGKENVLQSNHIKWDIDNNIFTVQGVYVLNQKGTVKTGQDATLDHNLNEIIPEQTVRNCRKEEPKCLAKL